MSSEEEVQPPKLAPTSFKVVMIALLVLLFFTGYKVYTHEKPAPIDTVARAHDTVKKAGFTILNDRQHRELGEGLVAVPVDMGRGGCAVEIIADDMARAVTVVYKSGMYREVGRDEVSLAAATLFNTSIFWPCYRSYAN